MSAPRAVLALSGGVGGAKLALGLHRVLPPGSLHVCVNTADDFEHLGLAISPDIDTALYTLGGLADTTRGWGRADETWSFMAELGRLGGETWFALGDRDLALHVERTRRLRAGEPLSAVVADFARRLGIASAILPMSDDPVRTVVTTDAGELAFQDYFVRRRCEPVVRAIRFEGAATARPLPAVLELLRSPRLEAVIVCPSNPYLSVDPLLAMPALRAALQDTAAPVVAVSPIIGGQAVKGPTAKIMRELGLESSAAAVVAHYAGLIDGIVLDAADAALVATTGVPAIATATWMRTLEDRERLAQAALGFAAGLRGGRRRGDAGRGGDGCDCGDGHGHTRRGHAGAGA